jgi:hypothetical protein
LKLLPLKFRVFRGDSSASMRLWRTAWRQASVSAEVNIHAAGRQGRPPSRIPPH